MIDRREIFKQRDNEMYQLYKSGVSQIDIAKQAHLCYRHTKRIIAEQRKLDKPRPLSVK